ncbi:MAG: tetratricopeptide repeat protein [Saprospiraceae bacterium]|nr:tetratricopeptide repeat protein [Saprospiraceae bacterium]
MIKRILLIFGCLYALECLAQDPRLAQQYFDEGEYEKSADLYAKLHEQSLDNDYFFTQFLECKIQLQDYDAAENALKKEIKRVKYPSPIYVVLGFLYEKQNKTKEAEEQYTKAIEKLPKDQFTITKVGANFMNANKLDFGILAYEKGYELLDDKIFFSQYLADLHNRKGDVQKFIFYNLNTLTANNMNTFENCKSNFQRYLKAEDYTLLQTQLFERIQESPLNESLVEMLAWSFLQKKDYKSALRQLKALDKQRNELGDRIFNLGVIAANDKDYTAAIESFEYIINTKGPNAPSYIESKRMVMDCKKKMIVEDYVYTKEELLSLEDEYESFLNEFGRNTQTISIIQEQADLEAYYLNNIDKAINLLTPCLQYQAIGKSRLAEIKVSLADYYLISGERWEASLLYSQVDKDHGEDLIGQEARFKNAKLSYFFGDFDWAQSQFDILKSSTSKFIANDALDLSVFILENKGEDSIMAPLQAYAQAELAVFQNRFGDAFAILDSLLVKYPNNELEDDVEYLKAQIFFKKQEYQKAAEMYQLILDKYKEEIKADNALFELAQLYEIQLNNKEKAKELYEKLFIEYSGSTFAVEARKRFRILRGDKIQS